jgi:hypothetical protein
MALTDRDKRTLTIGGAIVGVLLVGFLLMQVLGGGGGEEGAGTSQQPLRTSSPGGGGTTGSPTLTPAPVYVPPARDPFSIPPGFPVSGGSSSGGSSSSGSTSSSSGGTTTTTTTATSTGTRTPAGGDRTTIGGHEVVLIDTLSGNGAEQATVSVDGTVYHPSAGETFGPNDQYQLQSVSGNCATFLFGDESFTLCVQQNK